MLHRLETSLSPALLLIWAGMVIGISLLTVPAQFSVPGLERPVAFQAVRQIFEMFTRAQFGLLTIIAILAMRQRPPKPALWAMGLIAATLLIQAIWLLPDMAARTDMIRSGTTPPPSWTHRLYESTELAKLIALLLAAWLVTGRHRPYR